MSQHHFKLVIRKTQTEVKIMLGWDRRLQRFELEVRDTSLPEELADWKDGDCEKINFDSIDERDLKTMVHVETHLGEMGLNSLDHALLTTVLKRVLLEKRAGDQYAPLPRNIIEYYSATKRPDPITAEEEEWVQQLLQMEMLQYQLM